jgi:hypothetical protein
MPDSTALVLTDFLADLFATGAVTLAGQLVPFEMADLVAADALLRRTHAQDALALAHQAPAFAPAAAIWAAQLLHRTMQLALLRDLDETVVQTQLADFAAPIDAAATYSADLTLRYLPDLLTLARDLAPGDALVLRLRELARQWPLSFVGTEPAPLDAPAEVLAHPALRAAYLDRIIAARDRVRASQPGVRELVLAALGKHSAVFWPDFQHPPLRSA